ncbi:uncharacterized protein LOC142976164 [Anticarsia gemmatalis]|uniref:uncharacterized protein LOC142976164 n=1 Tax=Anticarsia gemmatalis TaxID=129554 RepID=UPI003F76906E
MYKITVFLLISVAVCHGQTAGKPVYCGETPNNMLACLQSPHVLSTDVTSKCKGQTSECARVTCAFNENKWLNAGKVDRAKVTAHLNQLAKDHPEWKPVIDVAVPTCLAQDLPAQGVILNCPAYDVMHCILISFVQNTPASQWSTSPDCVYTRQFAGACAVCPSDCYAPAIPYGSCNACYRVPRPAAPAA